MKARLHATYSLSAFGQVELYIDVCHCECLLVRVSLFDPTSVFFLSASRLSWVHDCGHVQVSFLA